MSCQHVAASNSTDRMVHEGRNYHARCRRSPVCLLVYRALFYHDINLVWRHLLLVFGFLLLVGVLLFVTIAEMSIMLCYFQLCGEDYRWWWRSFTNSGSCAIYVFLYSIYFYNTQYQGDSVTSTVVYLNTPLWHASRCISCAVLRFHCDIPVHAKDLDPSKLIKKRCVGVFII